MESRIGSQWLNRVGVIALLFGVSYLLRYAFINNWVPASVRVWVAVAFGAAVIAGSELFRARGYRVLSLSLKAVGTGVIYLSLWAGFELYKVISGTEVFVGLALLTGAAVALAVREFAQVLAVLAFIGAFATPLLISIPSREGPLFLYAAMLDCAAILFTVRRGWWKLLVVSFAGTALLASVWYFEQYRVEELLSTALAATSFFTAYLLIIRLGKTPSGGEQLVLVLSVVNPAFYLLSMYALLSRVSNLAPGWIAVALAALYFFFMFNQTEERRYVIACASLGVSFLAVAAAFLFAIEWLSLAWFIEAGMLLGVGFWRDIAWLRWGALLLLCAAIVKAFAYDIWGLGLAYRTISFIALGVLLLVMSFVYQRYGFSALGKSGSSAPRTR